MDGAAAGSGGRDYSPYTHGRHDADKGLLGASIQFDLVGIAATCHRHRADAAALCRRQQRWAQQRHALLHVHVPKDFSLGHRPAAVVLVATHQGQSFCDTASNCACDLCC
jgi:hypothetical protein